MHVCAQGPLVSRGRVWFHRHPSLPTGDNGGGNQIRVLVLARVLLPVRGSVWELRAEGTGPNHPGTVQLADADAEPFHMQRTTFLHSLNFQTTLRHILFTVSIQPFHCEDGSISARAKDLEAMRL